MPNFLTAKRAKEREEKKFKGFKSNLLCFAFFACFAAKKESVMLTGYLILALLLMGIWGVIRKHNLIKKVIALNIVNSAIVMLFMYGGASNGRQPPILVSGVTDIVDPLPQALMLTAIVVGICVTALALALVYRMYQHYHTLDIVKIETLAAQEHA